MRATKCLARRSIRLKEYDYGEPGSYFVTICAYRHAYLFGTVRRGIMCANAYGRIVEQEWLASPAIRDEVEIDAFVVMPNHVHGIIWIKTANLAGAPGATAHDATPRGGSPRHVGAHGRAPLRKVGSAPYRPPRSLGSFVAGFKSACTKRINVARGSPGVPVWQRNYYERVLRNEDELNAARQYIIDNPTLWEDT